MKRNQRLSRVVGRVVIVGVDVAKRRHWATILNRDGFSLSQPFRFQNTRDGFLRLRARVEAAKQHTGCTRVVVGVEPSGHYWKPLAWFLKHTGYEVVLVNPYHVKRSKEIEDNSPTKSDQKDAGLIADLVRQGKYMSCILPKPVYADLRNLYVARESQRKQMNRALNRLEAWLDEYFPEFMQVFKSITRKAAMWVLEHLPLPDDILGVTVEDLCECLKRASSGRVGMKRAKALRQAAERSIGITEGLKGARQRLQCCLGEVRFYSVQLSLTESKMAEVLEETGFAEVLLSVPGVGMVSAAGLLAEIGDVADYTHHRQLQKLAGLNLTEQSSGERRGKRTISKRGRPGLRSVLYQISMSLVRNNSEFRALYQQLRTRSHNPLPRTSAMVAIMSRALRVLFYLARRRETYDGSKLQSNLCNTQVKSAA